MLLFHICTSMLKIIKMTNGMQERLHYSLQDCCLLVKLFRYKCVGCLDEHTFHDEQGPGQALV